MTTKERYNFVLKWFEENVPVAESELDYESPFQLLVAVILSAQCTDKRVNIITPTLFAKFPNPQTLAKAEYYQIFDLIKSISYPNNKSKHLVEMAKILVEYFNGEVPESIDDLQKLPGVGRKTANVIASVIFKAPVIAVDTHVFRVSKRVGLSSKKDVLGVEIDLTNNIPSKLRAISHHWLILHGRYICTARNPKCESCGIRPYCKYIEKAT